MMAGFTTPGPETDFVVAGTMEQWWKTLVGSVSLNMLNKRNELLTASLMTVITVTIIHTVIVLLTRKSPAFPSYVQCANKSVCS